MEVAVFAHSPARGPRLRGLPRPARAGVYCTTQRAAI